MNNTSSNMQHFLLQLAKKVRKIIAWAGFLFSKISNFHLSVFDGRFFIPSETYCCIEIKCKHSQLTVANSNGR